MAPIRGPVLPLYINHAKNIDYRFLKTDQFILKESWQTIFVDKFIIKLIQLLSIIWEVVWSDLSDKLINFEID